MGENPKKEYALLQPKDGECVLHCGHVAEGTCKGARFFAAPDPGIGFIRPDGTADVAQWLVCCNACFQLAGGVGIDVPIRGDARWKGDEPVILRPTVH